MLVATTTRGATTRMIARFAITVKGKCGAYKATTTTRAEAGSWSRYCGHNDNNGGSNGGGSKHNNDNKNGNDNRNRNDNI